MLVDVNQVEFIKTPLSNIIDELISRCSFLDGLIEEFPIREYLLQSVFIRMCGAQEQKLKCICWEIATNNYELRHDYLMENRGYGECSKYDSKRKVYELIYNACLDVCEKPSLEEGLYHACYSEDEREAIKRDWERKQRRKIEKNVRKEVRLLESNGEAPTNEAVNEIRKKIQTKLLSESEYKKRVRDEIKSYILGRVDAVMDKFVETDNIIHGCESEFKASVQRKKSSFGGGNFVPWEKDFLKGELPKIYEIALYNHRNRCAHNLNSVRNNLPTFNELNDSNNKYCNYYYRFYILLIIDEIFTKLFCYYQKLRSNCV